MKSRHPPQQSRQIFWRHVSLEKVHFASSRSSGTTSPSPVTQPSKNMPQLARYLQINTARDATPTKYDYALVMNGEDIETKPTYGEVQPKKNVTLFGTHDEKDFGSVG